MMNDIYIYGAGQWGTSLLNRIKNFYGDEVRVLAFIDQNKQGTIDEVPVISLKELTVVDIPVVIGLESRYAIKKVYKELKNKDISDIYKFKNRHNPRYCDDSFFDSECSKIVGLEEDLLPHIEVHAVDYCNLNCKACIHYSGLYKKEQFNKELVFSDIKDISNLTEDIISFYILGGEPLLRDDLDKVILYARDCLPKSDIQVLTNGLLISERLGKVWEAMRHANVTLTISEYEPTSRKRNEIIKVLQENKVPYIIRPYNDKEKFIKTISLNKDSKYEHTCICNGCVNVYKGKIARCPAIMYLEKLNSEFNINLPKDGIYSLDDFVNAKEVYEKMLERIPLCNHCIDYRIDWEQCDQMRKLEDFVVVE